MTLTEAKDVGAHLIHLLTQQRLLYRQLRELAQKQSSLVDGSNPEMLLRVLAGRQRIIDRLGAIDRGLKPIREQWQQIAKTLPRSERQQAQQLVEAAHTVMEVKKEDSEEELPSVEAEAKGEAETTEAEGDVEPAAPEALEEEGEIEVSDTAE